MAKAKKRKAANKTAAPPRRVSGVSKRKAAPRRRRVCATGMTTDIMEPLCVIGGALAGRLLFNLAPKSMSTTMVSGVITAAGVGAAMFLKSPNAKLIGCGVAATGAVGVLDEMGVINGLTTSGQNPYVVGSKNRRLPMAPVKMIAGTRTYRNPGNVRKIGSSVANNIPFTAGAGM